MGPKLPAYLGRALGLLRQQPLAVLRMIGPLCRGTWYLAFFRVTRRNVRIAWPFLAYTRVSITGPGSVRLGPGCSAYRNSLRGLSIVTLSADAEVEIGPGCDLGGLAIRCRNQVKIGARSLTASALVQDALFADLHSAARTGAHALAISPILLGNGTWFGRNACVLDGTELGDGSVIASGTLVRRVTHPGRVLVSGNPAFRPAPIDAIAALRHPT